jgi:hypothetical protein
MLETVGTVVNVRTRSDKGNRMTEKVRSYHEIADFDDKHECVTCSCSFPNGVGWTSCVCGKFHITCIDCRKKAVEIKLLRRFDLTNWVRKPCGSWIECPLIPQVGIAVALMPKLS